MPGKIQELQRKLAQTSDSKEKEAFQKELDKIYQHDFSKSGQAKGIATAHVSVQIGSVFAVHLNWFHTSYSEHIRRSYDRTKMITVVLHHVGCVLVCAAGVFSGTFGYHAAGVSTDSTD